MSENIVNVVDSFCKITVTSESTNNESLDVVIENNGEVTVIEASSVSAVFSRDLPMGYPLSFTTGTLSAERVINLPVYAILAGNGILVNNNNGTYTISAIDSGGGGPTNYPDILFDIDNLTTYTGFAPSGSLTSASVWTIKQTVYDTGGNVITNLTAINVAWDDRLTEDYS